MGMGKIGRTLNFHDDTDPCEVRDIIEPRLLAQACRDGLMRRETLPQYGVCVISRTRGGTLSRQWNDATVKNIIVVGLMDSGVKGRSFDHILPLGDKDFPEAWRANWPLEQKPVVTAMLDGWQALLIQDKNGDAQFVGPHGARFEPYVWAKRQYEIQRVTSGPRAVRWIWPQGYTPVFEIMSSKLQKVNSEADQFYLVAIVNNRTGQELPYDIVRQYAAMMNLHTPMQFVSEDAARRCVGRGYVVRYDFEDRPPLRIKVETEEYIHARSLLENFTARHVVGYLKESQPNPHLDNKELPFKFRFWNRKCNIRLTNMYVSRTEEFNKLWTNFPHKWDAQGQVQKALEYLNDLGKIEYSTAMLERVKGGNYRKAIWTIVEEQTPQALSYMESVTGGDITP